MKLDLVFAARRLWRARLSSSLVVLTLVLVGGVSAAFLAVAYQVYLRPLSYRDPHELVRITGRSLDVVGTVNVSPPDFRDLRRGLSTFRSIAAVSPFAPQLTLTGVGEPMLVESRRISGRYFETLGIALLAGREFSPADEQPPARPVILGERFWKERWQGRSVLGHVLALNGEPYEVVGVVPDREEVFGVADLWLPAQFPSEAIRGLRMMAVVGRLNRGTSLEQAQQDVAAVGQRLQREHPDTNANWQPLVSPLGDSVSAPLRSAAALTVVMVIILWLAACTAIAGLALSRTLQRSTEFSVRRAIGARNAQLLRAAGIEYVLLGSLGLAGALALSDWVAGGLRLVGLTPPAYRHDWRLSLAAVATLVAVAIASAVFATATAWGRAHLTQRTGATVARAPRHLLVAAQVAMAVAVVGVAAMLLGGMIRLRSVAPGFRADGGSYVVIALPPRYRTPGERAQFWAQLLDRLRAIGGVSNAAITSELPFTGQQNPTAFAAKAANGREASVQLRSISPSYFETARIALGRGRAFSPDDDGRHPHVVVVNQLFASMMFGSQDPIGQRVALNFSNPAHEAEIVGVVATIRHGGPAAAEAPEVYAPAAQTPLPRYTVLLRTNIEPQPLFTAIAREVHRADRDVAVAVPTRWSDAVEARFAVHQVRLALVMALAAIAMLLAGLSAFGTVGEMVNARTREFAVRIALGAAPSSLVGTVVADVGAYVAAALAVGMSLIPVLRALAASTMDGVVLPRGWPELAALALVTAVVAAATWLPTRQVERVDPASILRA